VRGSLEQKSELCVLCGEFLYTHQYTQQGLDPSGSKMLTLDVFIHITTLQTVACEFSLGTFQHHTSHSIHITVIIAAIVYFYSFGI
jgi:hypothetical protein